MAIDISDLNRIQSHSVQAEVPEGQGPYFILSIASAADTMPAWGQSPVLRDSRLREFWPTEPWLASTISSLAARNAAFSWRLEGPPRTCARIQEQLHLRGLGRGWGGFVERISCGMYSQGDG